MQVGKTNLQLTPIKVMGICLFSVWIVFVAIYVTKMIIDGEEESIVSVTEDYIDIGPDHGVRIPWHTIIRVALINDVPGFGRRIRGSNSFGSAKKGAFEIEGVGVGRVYVFTEAGPSSPRRTMRVRVRPGEPFATA